MDQFIKVAGTEGKVGGYFCRLPPLKENTGYRGSTLYKWATMRENLTLLHANNKWADCTV